MCKVKFEVEGYECLRCRHKWIPKNVKKPKTCPHCRSPYWDVPRKNETKK